MPAGLALSDLVLVLIAGLLVVALVLLRRVLGAQRDAVHALTRALDGERSRSEPPAPGRASSAATAASYAVTARPVAKEPLARRLALAEALAVVIRRDLEEALAPPGENPAALVEAARRAAARAERLATLASGGRARDDHTTLGLVFPLLREALAPRLEDVHLAFRAPESLPPVVGGADGWFTMLHALAENALDAMRGAGTLTIRAEPSPRDGFALVTVSDTGRGIEPAALPHVAEPFYTSRADAGAAGLGLAAVAAMLEALEGEMHVTSRVGEGTTVTLEVPFARPWSAARFAGAVLLADDDGDLRRRLARLLESFGLEVVQVESGSSARARLAAESDRFALAVLDVVMPGSPVPEVVNAARARRPDLPVLLISGYDTMQMVDAVLASGGVRFLRKPFTREELHGALSDLLGEEAGR
jgi:signal transduction histidine kinase/CheY-like chemotaxis protein